MTIAEDGAAGELAMAQWMQRERLPFVAVCQAQETFATVFAGSVKRPDFLLLFESLGLIAVDVKNYVCRGGVFTLGLREELRRAIAFERLFRMPLWYAYCDRNDFGNAWYWISALAVIELGEIRVNSETSDEFLAIDRDEFVKVANQADLAQLYARRSRGFSGVGGRH